MKTVNLTTLIDLNKETGLKVKITYECGFNSKTGVYIPKGENYLKVFQNNLNGGYGGNTLLIEVNEKKGVQSSFRDIRIGDILFSCAQLIVIHEKIKYSLKNKQGYLRLKANITYGF